MQIPSLQSENIYYCLNSSNYEYFSPCDLNGWGKHSYLLPLQCRQTRLWAVKIPDTSSKCSLKVVTSCMLSSLTTCISGKLCVLGCTHFNESSGLILSYLHPFYKDWFSASFFIITIIIYKDCFIASKTDCFHHISVLLFSWWLLCAVGVVDAICNCSYLLYLATF